MIIKSITIDNFQSYYLSQTVEFKEGLNLIIGNGGKGKSKLFNAFYWVLFGKIYITGIGWCRTDSLPSSAKMSMQRHDFFNKKALNEAEVGSLVIASVQMEITDDRGVDYIIGRSATAKRKAYDDWDSPYAWEVGTNVLKVQYDSPTGNRFEEGIMAEDKVNELFPDGIRNYIWFQGESLESLINFRDRETLKSAVKHISYFPYYEKLSEIISKSKDKIEKQEINATRAANRHNNAVKECISTIESLRIKLDGEKKKQKEILQQIDTIKIALSEDENKMSGLASYTSLVSKYKQCDLDIFTLNQKIFALDEYMRRQLPELWLIRGCDTLLEECKRLIENHKEEENTLPEKKYLDNPSRARLEEILRDKVCFVCGSKVEEGNEAYHYIKERMRLQDEYLREMEDYTNNLQLNKQFNMFIGKIQDYPNELSRSISVIDKQYNDTENQLSRLLAQRKKKMDEKSDYDKEIDEVKKKCGIDPIRQAESAGLLDSTIRVSRGNLERKQQQLAMSKSAIASLTKDLAKAEDEYSKLTQKDSSVVAVPETEWKNISIFLEDICKKVQESARKHLLRKIEERANLFYKKFTEHDKGYKGNVKIGDDYSIEFDAGLNTSHEDRKKMSIINALLSLNQDAMGIYYPFISDAPTSSFDIETSQKYLLGIKDIFKQSIIMTKDVDINSESFKTLRKQTNMGFVYVLESEIYMDDGKEPERHEVSTKINVLQ